MDRVRLFADTIIPARFLQEELIWETPKGTKIYTAKNGNKQCDPKTLFLKMRDANHPEKNGILREYQSLQLLQSSLGKNELRNTVPQPLDFDSEINCFAMTGLDGISVQKGVYFRLITGLNVNRLLPMAGAIGEWIGRFQCATKRTSRVNISSELHTVLSKLALCPGLSDNATKMFESAIKDAIDRSSSTNAVFCHGDFALRNVLFTEDGRVAVLDWEHMYIGHPLADPVWLVSNILLSTRYLARLGTIMPIVREFLGSWRNRTKDIGVPVETVVGLFVAGLVNRMFQLRTKTDIILKKRVLAHFSRLGLCLLQEWHQTKLFQ